MSAARRLVGPGRWLPGPATWLFVLLAGIYMLTWSGRYSSNDELLLLNASSSLVRHGDMRADLAAGRAPPNPGDLGSGPGYAFLPEIHAEILQPLLATPLYWLALRLPGLGPAHAVLLFNVLVCAGAGSLFFHYARRLGHGERASLAGALLLGLATIVWAYSDSFFQAPLASLLMLLAGFQLEGRRRRGWRAPVPALLTLLTLLLLPLAHRSALLALPALLLIAIPQSATPAGMRGRRFGLALLLAAATLLLLLVAQPGTVRALRDLLSNLVEFPAQHYVSVLHSYLISPGGSLWGTSPVLLLAVPGGWMLWRAGRPRQALVALVMVVGFALFAALLLGIHWFGGLSWPPRLLAPVVPFVLLAAMPVLERAVSPQRSRRLAAGMALLIAYSVWVQLSAISLPWEAYGPALPPEAGGYGDWSGGLNLLRWLRWVVIPGLWTTNVWDFAWLRMDAAGWPLLFGGMAAWAAWRIRRRLRQDVASATASVTGAPRLAGILPPLIVLALMAIALTLLPPDPLYDAPKDDLDALLQRLPQLTAPEDVILLNDLELEGYLLNEVGPDWPRMVSLPFHPGEKGSPEQAPRIESDNPEVLLHPSAAQQITAAAEARERLWLLAGNGPWLPWSVRPAERFMARNHYPLREIEAGPRARLLQYDTTPAPDPLLPGAPQWRAELRFGERITLSGHSLPRGRRYQPADALPVTFFWRATEAIEHDWTVAWFLAAADSPPAVQGWDSAPQAGLAPTTGWSPGATLTDNRALVLPADMPAGEYRILVVMYRIDANGEALRLPVAGAETRDGHVGILPARIQVG